MTTKRHSDDLTRRAFAAGAAAGAAALGLPWGPASAQVHRLKIGVILPLSGYQAETGRI
jgi:hypothetical protein